MTAIPEVSFSLVDFEALLATPDVRASLEAAAARQGIAAEEAMPLARQHARSIAANFSYPVARTFDRLLTWLWKRLLDGIEVGNIDVVRQIPSGHTIVYIPCHRSHFDYLLLSHVIFHGDLIPPHIAAGDNLDLPLIGPLLRRGGGFFMRRKFKDDPLYGAVFSAYLQGLVEKGLPIEFFIEGGRSRTGLMLKPRTGLLGMLVRNFVQRPVRPLVLVPVYLGYEKLPEGMGFVEELSGRPKQRETLFGALSAVRVLRQHFGRAYLSIGKPLDVAEWFDAHFPGWKNADTEKDDLRAAVVDLADEVVSRINAVAPVNPVNWVALALLEQPDHRASADVLTARIATLQTELKSSFPALAGSVAPAECIAQAARLGMVDVAGGMVSAPGDKAALLSYFRNNVLHHFVIRQADGKE